VDAFSERRIGELVVRIDRNLCVGFGDCIEVAPTVFVFDDDGIAVFCEPSPDPGAAQLLDACRACPVDALTVLDAAGAILAP
jgi:ferredoxin